MRTAAAMQVPGQFAATLSGTVNRSSMLETVVRVGASAQGSSASPRIFCTVLRYELVSPLLGRRQPNAHRLRDRDVEAPAVRNKES